MEHYHVDVPKSRKTAFRSIAFSEDEDHAHLFIQQGVVRALQILEFISGVSVFPCCLLQDSRGPRAEYFEALGYEQSYIVSAVTSSSDLNGYCVQDPKMR